MKQIEFKTSKGTFWMVDSPTDARLASVGTHCLGVKTDQDVQKDSNGWHHIYQKGLFFGLDIRQNYKISVVGFLKDLIEDQVSGVVDSLTWNFTNGTSGKSYRNYLAKSEFDFQPVFPTALESLHSLIESKGCHLQKNPIQESIKDLSAKEQAYRQLDLDWQEAERKTFYNPIIFKITNNE